MCRRFIPLEEALKIVSRFVDAISLNIEEAPLSESLRRVAAEDVKARIDVPPFDRSTVDGYAVRSSDIAYASEAQPISLKIAGRVQVGEVPAVAVQPRTAVQVPTGAMLPEGADSVVMLEYARAKGNFVTVFKATYPGENVLRKGSDVKAGSILVKAGHMITVSDIALLSAAGVDEIRVRRRPRIALFSIGDELIELGRKLEAGRIYDVNRVALKALIESCGCETSDLGIVPDNASNISRTLRQGLEISDVVVTSGSTSVGAEDVLSSILGGLGEPGIIVEGLAMRPGKPAIVAAIDHKLVFALPGHPTSAILTFRVLVEPLLRKLAGLGAPVGMFTATAATRIFAAKGLRTLVPVKLREEAGRLKAYPLPLETASLSALMEADGFASVPEGREFVDSGEEIAVLDLRQLS